MRIPNLIQCEDLFDNAATEVKIDGKYVSVRPEPYYRWYRRFTLAWGVFIGNYDAIKFYGQ